MAFFVFIQEQERWSGGSGTGGNPLAWRWLWTAAIFAATTAATSTAVANPIRTPEGANKVSCKSDSEEPPATTDALVGGKGCDRGCEGTTSSRCQIIGGGGGEGVGKNQVSATIPAAASNAAGTGGDKSSASPHHEKMPLRQTRSSDAQARYSASIGAGTSGGSGSSEGSGSSREGPPVLVKEGGIDLEGSVSALRGWEKLKGGAAVGNQEDENPWAGEAMALAGRPLFTSVTSTKVGTQRGEFAWS